MTTVSPNPYSPYANAHPDARHLLPSFLGALPAPGGLALTGCDRMAVVPDESLTDVTALLRARRFASLPPGLCPTCVAAAAGEQPEQPTALPPTTCQECGGGSSQGEWCALCRLELHDAWWPTREGASS
jgi:hypothetical protein